MKYLEDINSVDSIKIIILFLIEKANYYKDVDENLFSLYLSLIKKYKYRLERLCDHYE